jgi:hypothetical protein
MPSGLNAFEISDIQEEKTDAGLTDYAVCNNDTLQLKTAAWSFCGTQLLSCLESVARRTGQQRVHPAPC